MDPVNDHFVSLCHFFNGVSAVICTDHQDNKFGLTFIEDALIKTPTHVLGPVSADSQIDRVQVFDHFPSSSVQPVGNGVAEEKDPRGSSLFAHFPDRIQMSHDPEFISGFRGAVRISFRGGFISAGTIGANSRTRNHTMLEIFHSEPGFRLV